MKREKLESTLLATTEIIGFLLQSAKRQVGYRSTNTLPNYEWEIQLTDKQYRTIVRVYNLARDTLREGN
jgi:hypothetical protein